MIFLQINQPNNLGYRLPNVIWLVLIFNGIIPLPISLHLSSN
ncbi:uncharacterized protein YhhL (DUF1145 family) [Lysinibacillus sp. TE18511]